MGPARPPRQSLACMASASDEATREALSGEMTAPMSTSMASLRLAAASGRCLRMQALDPLQLRPQSPM
eukprot:9005800-Pyramimonas_sp.AAC.1